MARSNTYLFNSILPGDVEPQIVRILDKADNWNSLFLETLNDSWRMSKDKRKKASRKIDRLANEIVRDLLEWKLELAREDNQKELQKLQRHVEEEHI